MRYAVLRWFETLPSVAPGEDVDILVADEDMPHLRPFLQAYHVPPRTQKFDVYSVSGLPGSDFHTVPYLPADFATRLLDRSVLLRGRFRVPGDQDHFDSLAYHAVYHKGERSGLPENARGRAGRGGGRARLRGRAGRARGAPGARRLRHAGRAWTATSPTRGCAHRWTRLDKLAVTNPWLRARLEKLWGPTDAGLPGLAVFVLRERAEHLLGRLCERAGA